MDKILELLNIPVLMEPDRLNGFFQGWRAGLQMAAPRDEKPTRKVSIEAQTLAMGMNDGYIVTPGGIALIGVFGPIFKGWGPYGYADQSDLRATVRQAANDAGVTGILFLIDSPGGSVAGTADLAAEIRAADAVKPCMAYIEDCGCSAAYWIAASCREIYSNGGMVGSIGVVTALYDMTKMAADMGIKVIPIITGKFKAVGMPGTEVKPEDVAYVQAMIDSIFDDFVAGVAKTRPIKGATIRGMEAKVFVGEEAVNQKLIDGVTSFDKAFAMLGKVANAKGANRKAKALLQIEEMENE